MCKLEFSIIIPVYNTKIELLKRCLDSIKWQSYQSYEIIVIDDGSSKKCAKEIDLLKNNYKKVCVYHIVHTGVSNARNIGILKARCEWILFVDSDDMISKYMLEDAHLALQRNKDVDIVYGYVKYEKVHISLCEKKATEAKFEILSVAQKKKLLQHMISLNCDEYKENGAYINRGPVAKVIKKTFLLQHSFDVGLSLGEDVIWNINILKDIPKILVVRNIWYYYIRNNDSTSKRYNPNVIIEERKMLDRLNEIIGGYSEYRASILSNTMERLIEIISSYYLHSNYKGCLSEANKEFLRVRQLESFSRLSRFKYFLKLSLKNKIKWVVLMKNPYSIYLYKIIFILRIFIDGFKSYIQHFTTFMLITLILSP